MPFALDWNINPLVFLEFAVVLAFALGWMILEWKANLFDRERDRLNAEAAAQTESAAHSEAVSDTSDV